MLRPLLRSSPSRISSPLPRRYSHILASKRPAGDTRYGIALPGEARLQGRPLIAPSAIQVKRSFHATQRNQLGPVLPVLAGFLKASTTIEIARTAARIALTFVPVILIKNLKSRKELRWAEKTGKTDEARKELVLKRIRNRTILFHTLLFIPVLLFWATIAASLERTPLTGRWRLILLSPEEEEDIAGQLAGPGWYQAVGEILSQEGPPQLVSPSDWRFQWVQDTLRRLEYAIPVLQREHELVPHWADCAGEEGEVPLPPPADFPLRPRPRASEYLRRFAELTAARTVHPAPHALAGPPYSLLLVDKPDAANAFSYGFGPDGAGGVVVFSGFLDEVLAKHPSGEQVQEPQEESSWLTSAFRGLLGISQSPLRAHPQPTPEQTSQLAILLAHELAHLVLAHHIETLSSGSIIWPGIVSIVTDVFRAILFPVTMLFGPFVNDALAGMGKVGSGEFAKLTEYCTSQTQEVEADIVSARLLAHAGFDPRHAVHFWEERSGRELARTMECSPAKAERILNEPESTSLVRRWMGETHPMSYTRVQQLKRELERWERERADARARHLQEDLEHEREDQAQGPA
ncbi:hypothetical protein CERSUDRAFT_118092 [Gelatoporia subvermispora B]|uniref:Peptidase M48 domain-containing protein n=1 Tax=Ceriporiopsis subvermispora (strain B) TaxID=914234 RepID=M2QMY1_CERS8|nr:hypothetical protein CERSUDRAFT_118092 [Gelatoporia subvermispora B]